jgi:hypothetical protein
VLRKDPLLVSLLVRVKRYAVMWETQRLFVRLSISSSAARSFIFPYMTIPLLCLCTCMCLYVRPSVCLPACLSVRPSVRLPACLPVRLSVWLPACLPVCLSVNSPWFCDKTKFEYGSSNTLTISSLVSWLYGGGSFQKQWSVRPLPIYQFRN